MHLLDAYYWLNHLSEPHYCFINKPEDRMTLAAGNIWKGEGIASSLKWKPSHFPLKAMVWQHHPSTKIHLTNIESFVEFECLLIGTAICCKLLAVISAL